MMMLQYQACQQSCWHAWVPRCSGCWNRSSTSARSPSVPSGWMPFNLVFLITLATISRTAFYYRHVALYMQVPIHAWPRGVRLRVGSTALASTRRPCIYTRARQQGSKRSPEFTAINPSLTNAVYQQ